MAEAERLLRAAKRPLVVAGGGVPYAQAESALATFCAAHGVPAGETQSGKSTRPAGHPMNMVAIGVIGTEAPNAPATEADVILAIGTRPQDFITGPSSLFSQAGRRIIRLNVQPFNAGKHGSDALVADALADREDLKAALPDCPAPAGWTQQASDGKRPWLEVAARYTAAGNDPLPSDPQVIGALQRQSRPGGIIVNAAEGAPGQLHMRWQAARPLGYHMEYGF